MPLVSLRCQLLPQRSKWRGFRRRSPFLLQGPPSTLCQQSFTLCQLIRKMCSSIPGGQQRMDLELRGKYTNSCSSLVEDQSWDINSPVHLATSCKSQSYFCGSRRPSIHWPVIRSTQFVLNGGCPGDMGAAPKASAVDVITHGVYLCIYFLYCLCPHSRMWAL